MRKFTQVAREKRQGIQQIWEYTFYELKNKQKDIYLRNTKTFMLKG